MGVIDEVDSVDFSSTMKSSQKNNQTPTAGGQKPSSAQQRTVPPQPSYQAPRGGKAMRLDDDEQEDGNVGEEEYD